jgi:tRNA A-37 threonylcarbamoyl transferase component Bud32
MAEPENVAGELTQPSDSSAAQPAEADAWSPSTLVGGLGALVRPGDAAEVVPGAPPQFGEHDLLEEIARGGMGVVFKARHRALGRTVALKMILHGTLASPQMVQRFYQEAKAAAALDHPGIVPIHDIGQINGQHYFTMTFIEGSSLAALVREEGPLPPARAVPLMQAVVAAVGHAHAKGIIHRDLKPDNVLIDRDGRPRITDFGLAKLRDTEPGANLTGTGQILGTPAYMAPEQAMGAREAGAAADVYALGGILYYVLTGRPPFSGGSLTELLFSVVQKPPVPPRQINPDVLAELEAVCLKCLEKDPQKRYASAEELGRALAGLVPPAAEAGDPALDQTWPATMVGTAPAPVDPTAVLSAESRGPASPPAPSRRALVLGLAGLAALAAVVAVVAWGPWRGRGAGAGTPESGGAADSHGKAEPGPRGITRPGVADKAAPAGLAWLLEMEKQGRADFNLKVSLDGVKPDREGVYRLREGQGVRLRVEVDQDAYVGVWTVDPQGEVVQLYPAGDRGDFLVKRGKPQVIPPDGVEDFEVTAGGGLERVVVVASTRPWDLPEGQRNGAYTLFKTRQEREKWQETLRGLRVRGGLAQEVLPYRVAPK